MTSKLQKAFENAFERIDTPLTLNGEFAMKGIAAALSLDKNTHVIITAPNWECLRRAWAILVNIPLDESKAQIVCEALIGKLDYSEIEPRSPKPVRPTRPVRPERNTVKYWFYDKRFKDVSEYFYSDHNGEYKVRLGPVETGTLEEVKLLMRKAGFTRSEIQDVTIDDDIPF